MEMEFDSSVDLSIGLFVNSDPDETWVKALLIARCIEPDFDGTATKKVFDDVTSIFRGDYPGYCAIKTPYHDLTHTLNVFICAIRLMHGVYVSGTKIAKRDIQLVMIAALMHDIGYAQTPNEASGTGAQFTRNHVERGIRFMRRYFADHDLFPRSYIDQIEAMMRGTDHTLPFREIRFPSTHTMMLGQIVATADYAGQMADRAYLEKLQLLFEEFREAQYGDYEDMNDLLQKTGQFYEATRKTMDNDLGRMYHKLRHHFRNLMGIDRNFYMESIEKNFAYLRKIVQLSEEEYLPKLRRGEIDWNDRRISLG